MRRTFTSLHRYAGLVTALFLVFCGLTGAVISWDHELDEWLNPHLLDARTPGVARDPLVLAAAIEARHPQAQVVFVPLVAEPGHSLAFGVEARVDPATGWQPELGFNQVFVDPASGAELGRRDWGAVWPITRESFVSFLYVLHFSLHLPEMFGTDRWGIWLLGVIALIWTVDCFVGFYLTLPPGRRMTADVGVVQARSDDTVDDVEAAVADGSARRGFWARWRPAWSIRAGAGSYKLNFDLHRAVSLWTWILLFIVAFTAFSLNLYREVFFPAMSLVSDVTPTPFDLRTPSGPRAPIPARIGFGEAIARAEDAARVRGWEAPPGSVFYAREFGIYGVSFHRPEDGHGAGGVGHREIYIDGGDGRVLGDREPWQGTAADLFVQAQFPLHSGRILGLPGRILISAMGLVVAMLSITGVVIWWRKRTARSIRPRRS